LPSVRGKVRADRFQCWMVKQLAFSSMGKNSPEAEDVFGQAAGSHARGRCGTTPPEAGQRTLCQRQEPFTLPPQCPFPPGHCLRIEANLGVGQAPAGLRPLRACDRLGGLSRRIRGPRISRSTAKARLPKPLFWMRRRGPSPARISASVSGDDCHGAGGRNRFKRPCRQLAFGAHWACWFFRTRVTVDAGPHVAPGAVDATRLPRWKISIGARVVARVIGRPARRTSACAVTEYKKPAV